MIPKKIFFIWLGNNIPLYIKYVINEYKKINPDFSINFIHYNINQIENIFYNKDIYNIYDKLLYNSILSIINKD
jgi:mannosyltransferase OCH1-like enzyme